MLTNVFLFFLLFVVFLWVTDIYVMNFRSNLKVGQLVGIMFEEDMVTNRYVLSVDHENHTLVVKGKRLHWTTSVSFDNVYMADTNQLIESEIE